MNNNKYNDLVKFTESSTIDSKLFQKVSKEELRETLSKCPSRLTETLMPGDSLESDCWWVPISFYNKINGNNRNYSKDLWKNVIDNQKDTWLGSPMLADHPADDGDGSPKDICGVWLDAKLGPQQYDGTGLVYGLLTPSGTLGKDLREHLSKGLKVGTSSSGYGKVLSDNITIDPNSYKIERLSDWVLTPSQGTYFSYDENSVVNSSNNKIRESINNKEESVFKENTVNNKLSKLEEKKFRKDMELFLQDAQNIQDPQEKLQEFEEIKSYLDEGACPDLKEKIEAKIQEQKQLIATAVKEKLELKETLNIENPQDLKEKLTKLTEDVNIIKAESNDWKAVAKKLQHKLNETRIKLASTPTRSYVKYQKDKSANLLKENSELKTLNSKLQQENQKVLKENTKPIETPKEHQISAVDNNSLVEKLTKEQKVLNESITAKNSEIAKLQEKLNSITIESSKVLENQRSLLEATKNQLDLAVKESKSLRESNNSKIQKIELLKKATESLDNSLESNKKELIKNQNRLHHINNFKNRSLKRKNATISRLKNQTEALQHRVKKVAINESIKQQGKLNEQQLYYESLLKTYGNSIIPYKHLLADAKNLTEAKNTFFTKILNRLPESKEIDVDRLPESLAITPEDRASKLGNNNFKKESFLSRMPKGWL